MSNFSNNLRALRMSNSISQKELAKKLSIDFRIGNIIFSLNENMWRKFNG